jgi:hypothetical protein
MGKGAGWKRGVKCHTGLICHSMERGAVQNRGDLVTFQVKNDGHFVIVTSDPPLGQVEIKSLDVLSGVKTLQGT